LLGIALAVWSVGSTALVFDDTYSDSDCADGCREFSVGNAIALSCKFASRHSGKSFYSQGLRNEYEKNFLIDRGAAAARKAHQSWQSSGLDEMLLETSDFEYTFGWRSGRRIENLLGKTSYQTYWISTRIDRVTLSSVQEEAEVMNPNGRGWLGKKARVIGEGSCSIVPTEKVQDLLSEQESDRKLREEEKERLLEIKKGKRLI
jgi:hypothetical protein